MKNTAADERRSARANVFLSGVILSEGVCHPVRIRNLSEHGALVDGDVSFGADAPVTLECKGKAINCWIAWVADGVAGIHFREPERQEDLLPAPKLCRQIARDTRVADFRRPGLKSNELTHEEKTTLREWATSSRG